MAPRAVRRGGQRPRQAGGAYLLHHVNHREGLELDGAHVVLVHHRGAGDALLGGHHIHLLEEGLRADTGADMDSAKVMEGHGGSWRVTETKAMEGLGRPWRVMEGLGRP